MKIEKHAQELHVLANRFIYDGQTVEDMERSLSEFSSRSSTYSVLIEYFRARRRLLPRLLSFYALMQHRGCAFQRNSLKQQSLARFVNRIKTQLCNDGKINELAYGSWGGIAGRPGRINSGIPPCIGVKLRSELAKHFVVVSTPEAYTSKLCCVCDEVSCGSCASADENMRNVMRQRLVEASQRREVPEEEWARARRFQVRGLRRCSNEACAVILNRDRNGAYNIGKRFKRLYDGESPLSARVWGDPIDAEAVKRAKTFEDRQCALQTD